MKKTISLKELSDLSSGAVQVTHATAPATPESSPQATAESVQSFPVPPNKSGESFRELLHQRYNTPSVSAISNHRWGINE